jgi:hypothetical protein
MALSSTYLCKNRYLLCLNSLMARHNIFYLPLTLLLQKSRLVTNRDISKLSILRLKEHTLFGIDQAGPLRPSRYC